MAPPAADVDVQGYSLPNTVLAKATNSRLSGPLKSSGSLDSYDQFDVTAVIGREFPGIQLSSILHDDDKIRDLAILGESLL